MLFKDLPEYIKKIALKERKRYGCEDKIKANDCVTTFFGRGGSRQGTNCRSSVSVGDYTHIDKRLDMKNKAKGNRKPIGIKI